MDDIVKQAMAKWPNVPDCYGWLGLDARGAWRMRDERAQHLNAPGDKVTQAKLLGFINRNYCADERGRWYFQNGPQRVYLNLEATPYIARTDPQQGLLLHTGEAFGPPERAYMTEAGELIVEGGGKVAQVDDRDVAQLMAALELDGAAPGDEALMAWLEGAPGSLALRVQGQLAPVERIARDSVPQRFGFERLPAP
ncbi:MAG: DUF2946 family protein [Pseudomonadota bacterium]|nr:DUF2946 family protein [Pseudomonadota bacterium]